jgi:hypothetical protein
MPSPAVSNSNCYSDLLNPFPVQPISLLIAFFINHLHVWTAFQVKEAETTRGSSTCTFCFQSAKGFASHDYARYVTWGRRNSLVVEGRMRVLLALVVFAFLDMHYLQCFLPYLALLISFYAVQSDQTSIRTWRVIHLATQTPPFLVDIISALTKTRYPTHR